ncbi:MAG: ABC transporter permease [Legionellales bacterium]|nr:ABC transporter permease [Legionellales bacterium]
MRLKQHFQQALMNILSAKLRSFLAVLGILVGTGSVVALVSGGQLATKKALDHIRSLGSDLMSVNIYSSGGGNKNSGAEQFDINHVESMRKMIEEIKIISPYTSSYSPIIFEGKQLGSNIIGVTDDLKNTVKIKMKKGRFISFLDKYEYFCVLGNKLYRQIKESYQEELIGKQIKLGHFYYTIIGIADFWPENSFFNSDINSAVLIPINSSKIISKYAIIRDFVIQLEEGVDLVEVQEEISEFVADISPTYKLFFRSASQIIQSMQSQSQIFTLLLGMIGGISLIVGGIGVMNVMLVSVVERKREIGIRMAVGAKRKDIRMLFLIESITLAVLGGFMGIILGVFTSYIIAVFSGWGFALFLLPPILGFIVSVATGVFFGFYPAYSASKLDPIQTLRYE